jgi:hypothetical protein
MMLFSAIPFEEIYYKYWEEAPQSRKGAGCRYTPYFGYFHRKMTKCEAE